MSQKRRVKRRKKSGERKRGKRSQGTRVSLGDQMRQRLSGKRVFQRWMGWLKDDDVVGEGKKRASDQEGRRNHIS